MSITLKKSIDKRVQSKYEINEFLRAVKIAVEEKGTGVVEDKVIKNHYAIEYVYNAYKNESSFFLG